MGDADFLLGYSRSVALDDFDEESEESEEELEQFHSERRKDLPPALPSYVSWNPVIAESLLKTSDARLDMRYLVIGIGQKACDILEAMVDIDNLDINGAVFIPKAGFANPRYNPTELKRDLQSWTSVASQHSAAVTNYIYTTVDLTAACGLLHTAGFNNRRRSPAVDPYLAGSSIGKQMLDGSFNLANLEQVVIFEVLPADRYNGDRPASDLLSSPVMRYLKTSEYDGPDLSPVTMLEPPNLLSGLSADLLCRCEYAQRSALLLTCYSDGSCTELFSVSYEPLSKILSNNAYLSTRNKSDAVTQLRKIRERSTDTETDELASLYI